MGLLSCLLVGARTDPSHKAELAIRHGKLAPKGVWMRMTPVLSGVLFVCLNAFGGIALPAGAQTTAPNEWTWMGGSNVSPAVGNVPNGRYQATTWTDNKGNFWLFGGNGGINLPLNDLWKFDPSTNQWAKVAGSSTGQSAGVYGTLGTPSSGNTPGAREDASGWTDSHGNLWLFGGHGMDASGNQGILNDLWEFNPSTGWTWMSGSSTIGNSCFAYDIGETVCAQPSVYGTLETPAPGNTPGSREAAITWADNKGNLWLFGGWSYDISVQTRYYFNELWEYNTSTNQWAWMGGSSTRDGSACLSNVNLWYLTCGEPGVYGTIGHLLPGTFQEAARALRNGPTAKVICGCSVAVGSTPTATLATPTIFGSLILPQTNGHGWVETKRFPPVPITTAVVPRCTARWGLPLPETFP